MNNEKIYNLQYGYMDMLTEYQAKINKKMAICHIFVYFVCVLNKFGFIKQVEVKPVETPSNRNKENIIRLIGIKGGELHQSGPYERARSDFLRNNKNMNSNSVLFENALSVNKNFNVKNISRVQFG